MSGDNPESTNSTSSDRPAAIADIAFRAISEHKAPPKLEEFNELDLRRHLPAMLLNTIGPLLAPIKAQVTPPISAEQFPHEIQRVESDREYAFQSLLSLIAEHQQSHDRTSAVLNQIWSNKEPFVLYLRNFDLTGAWYQAHETSVQVTFLSQGSIEDKLSSLLAPLHVLKLQNRHDFDYHLPAIEPESWQGAVETLIEQASFIVFNYTTPSEGVELEFDLLAQSARLKDTYLLLGRDVTDVPVAPEALAGVSRSAELSDLDKDRLRQLAERRTAQVSGAPPATRRHWLNGVARAAHIAAADALTHRAYMHLANATHHPRELYDVLDCGAEALGRSLALEDTVRAANASYLIGLARISAFPHVNASAYFQWAAENLAPGDPRRLTAAQLWALEARCLLDTLGADAPTGYLENWRQAVETARKRSTDNVTALATYLHEALEHSVVRSGQGTADRQSSWEATRSAYAAYRETGEPPIFETPRNIANLAFWLTADPSPESPEKLARAFRGEASSLTNMDPDLASSIVRALEGTIAWEQATASASSPESQVELTLLRTAWTNSKTNRALTGQSAEPE